MAPSLYQSDNSTRLEEARNALRHSADARRNRGNTTRESSIAFVAAYYGLALRRAKALIFGESVRLQEHEMLSIQERYRTHLEEESKYLTAAATLARERLRKLDAGEPIDYSREPGTEHMTRRNPTEQRTAHYQDDEHIEVDTE